MGLPHPPAFRFQCATKAEGQGYKRECIGKSFSLSTTLPLATKSLHFSKILYEIHISNVTAPSSLEGREQ